MNSLQALSEQVRQTYGAPKQALLTQAIERLQQNEGDADARGLTHAVAVAAMLNEWAAPFPVLIAGLLHDLFEPASGQNGLLQEIRAVFGDPVAEVAQVLARLRHVWYYELGQTTDSSENFSRAASELRQAPMAALVRFADQIVRFSALDQCSTEEKELLATANKGFLVPLANRLGVQFLSRQLEDQAFQILQPNDYYRTLERYPISSRLAAAQPVLDKLRQALENGGIGDAQIELSPVSVYWLFRHESDRGKKRVPLYLAQPYLINVIEWITCYQALGAIHKVWPPLPDTFVDYIASPRPNGYRALHTQVKYGQGEMLRCLIRTRQMTQVAERGIAAAWVNVPSELLPTLPDWNEPPAGMIAVFTPMGESRILPAGSIVVDFAFAVHRSFGYSLTGALVNDKYALVTKTLQNGDVVKLLKGPHVIGPSAEWIKLVKTPRARGAIRTWLTRNQSRHLIEQGKKHLNREMQSDGLTLVSPGMWDLLQRTSKTLWRKNPEELLKDIGLEIVEPSDVYNQMRQFTMPSDIELSPLSDSLSGQLLSSDPKYPYRFARCCNPSFPDPIVGYLTNRDVVSIHNANCPEIRFSPTIPLDWARISLPYRENVDIVATNRLGIVRDIAISVANAGISPISFHADVDVDGSAIIEFGLSEIPGDDIRHMIDELNDIPGVRSVESHPPHMPARTHRNTVAFRHFQNPYTKEAVEGDLFFGREEELNRLFVGLRFLAPGASMSIWGPRRIGKTSLLKEFARRHRARDDYLAIRIDMALAVPTTLTFLVALMTAIERQCANPELRAPNYGRVKKDPLGYFQAFISQALNVESKHLILMLDEFELLETIREEGVTWLDISRLFKALIQSGNGITFIFAGSGSLRRLLAKVPSLALLQEVTKNEILGCLTSQAAQELIRQAPDIVYEDVVVNELVEMTVGHPWYLQQICNQLFDEVTKSNTKRLVTKSLLDRTLAQWLPAQELDFVSNLIGSQVGAGHQLQRKGLLTLTAVAESSATNPSRDRWVSLEQITRTGILESVSPEELQLMLEELTRIDSLQTQNNHMYRLKVPICELWFQNRYSVTSFTRDMPL